MPVLHLGGDHHHRTGRQADRRLARLLIPALAGGTQQQLAAAPDGVVDVPVVAALNWTAPSQSPGFTGLNAIQNCIFSTLFDEVLLLFIFPFLQHPILLLPD